MADNDSLTTGIPKALQGIEGITLRDGVILYKDAPIMQEEKPGIFKPATPPKAYADFIKQFPEARDRIATNTDNNFNGHATTMAKNQAKAPALPTDAAANLTAPKFDLANADKLMPSETKLMIDAQTPGQKARMAAAIHKKYGNETGLTQEQAGLIVDRGYLTAGEMRQLTAGEPLADIPGIAALKASAPAAPTREQLVQFSRNRVMAYNDAVITINAVDEALSGRSLDAGEFKRLSTDSLLEVQTKPKKAWELYQEIRKFTEAMDVEGKIADIKSGKVRPVMIDGKPYLPMMQAVSFGGEVYNVQIEISVDNPSRMKVQLGKYVVENGKLQTQRIQDRPADVTSDPQTRKMEIDVTKGFTPAERLERFGDSGYELKITEDRSTPFNMHLRVVQDIFDTKDPKLANKPGKLVVAGTGTGKTPMVLGYAAAEGKAIIATPPGLATDMLKDAKRYFPDPALLTDEQLPKTPAELDALLAKNKALVITHDQLVKIAPIIGNHNVFIDEIHELTIDLKTRTSSPEKTAVLNDMAEKINLVGLTATPTKALYDIFGTEAAKMTSYEMQNDHKLARIVRPKDATIGTKGANNNDAMKRRALVEMLGRQEVLKPQDITYTDPKTLVKQGMTPQAAAEAALQSNLRTSSDFQGMAFFNDAPLGQDFATALEQIRAGTFADLPKLQAEIAQYRMDTQNAARKDYGLAPLSEPPAVDLRKEMTQSQQRSLSSNLRIDTIVALAGNPKLERELRMSVIDGNSNLERNLTKLMQDGKMPSQEDAFARIEKMRGTVPDSYLDAMKQVVTDIYAAPAEGKTAAFSKAVDTQAAIVAEKVNPVLHLAENATGPEIENAKMLINKGIANKIVSNGPLGTGYSNEMIMSVTQTISNSTGSPDGDQQIQGRSHRSNGHLAFNATLMDANVEPDTRMTSGQIYNQDSVKYYMSAVEAARIASTSKPPGAAAALVPAVEKQGKRYYSQQQAEAIFAQLKSNPNTPYEVTGLCEVRREQMLMNMMEKGIEPGALGRISVDPGSDALGKPLSLEHTNKLGKDIAVLEMQLKDPKATPQQIKEALGNKYQVDWSFHTAPTIEIWDPAANKPVTLVLDPVLNDGKPMTKSQWLETMKANDGYVVYDGKVGATPTLNPTLLSDAQIAKSAAILKKMGIDSGAPTREQTEKSIAELKPAQKKSLIADLYVDEKGAHAYDAEKTLEFMKLTMSADNDLNTLDRPEFKEQLSANEERLKFAVESQNRQKATKAALQTQLVATRATRAPVVADVKVPEIKAPEINVKDAAPAQNPPPQEPVAPKLALSEIQAGVLVHMAKSDPQLLKNSGMAPELVQQLAEKPTFALLQEIEKKMNTEVLKNVTDDYVKAKGAKPAPANGSQKIGAIMLITNTGELIFNWKEVSKDPVKLTETLGGLGGGFAGIASPIIDARVEKLAEAGRKADSLARLSKLSHGAFTISTPLMIKGGLEQIGKASERESNLVAAHDIIHGTTTAVVGTEAAASGIARMAGVKLGGKLATRAIPVVGEVLLMHDAGMLGSRGVVNLADALGIIHMGKDDTSDLWENIERLEKMRKQNKELKDEIYADGRSKHFVAIEELPRVRDYKQLGSGLEMFYYEMVKEGKMAKPPTWVETGNGMPDPNVIADDFVRIANGKIGPQNDAVKQFNDVTFDWSGKYKKAAEDTEHEARVMSGASKDFNDYAARYNEHQKLKATDPKAYAFTMEMEPIIQRLENSKGHKGAEHMLKNKADVRAAWDKDPALFKDTQQLLKFYDESIKQAMADARLRSTHEKLMSKLPKLGAGHPRVKKALEDAVTESKYAKTLTKEMLAENIEVISKRRIAEVKAIAVKLEDPKGRLEDPQKESDRRKKIVEDHFKQNTSTIYAMGLHLKEQVYYEGMSEIGKQLFITDWRQLSATLSILRDKDGQPLNINLEKDLGIINNTDLASMGGGRGTYTAPENGKTYEYNVPPYSYGYVQHDKKGEERYQYKNLTPDFDGKPIPHSNEAFVDLEYKHPEGMMVKKRLIYRTSGNKTEIISFADPGAPQEEGKVPQWLKNAAIPALENKDRTQGERPSTVIGMILAAEDAAKNTPEVKADVKAIQDRETAAKIAAEKAAAAEAENRKIRREVAIKRRLERMKVYPDIIDDMSKKNPKAITVAKDEDGKMSITFAAKNGVGTYISELSDAEQKLRFSDSKAFLETTRSSNEMEFLGRMFDDVARTFKGDKIIVPGISQAIKDPKTGADRYEYTVAYKVTVDPKDAETMAMLKSILPDDKYREITGEPAPKKISAAPDVKKPGDKNVKSETTAKAAEESALGMFALSSNEQEIAAAMQSLGFASTPEGQQAFAALTAQLDSVRRTAPSPDMATDGADKAIKPITKEMEDALRAFAKADKQTGGVPLKPRDKNNGQQIG